jgi:predicted negative regulator of RcsB-dependent stress response
MDAGTSDTRSTEAFYKALAWLHANQKRLLIGGGIIIGAGLIAGIYAWKKSSDAADANATLFNLPLSTMTGAPSPAAPTPPSTYLSVAERYPGTSAAEYAQLLGAEALFVDNKYKEAEREFSAYLTDHPGGAMAAQSQMGVAASLEAQGNRAEAIQKYSTIISTYPSDPSVTEPAKLTLARLYEQANRPDQSLSLYAELARNANAYDPWAAEARERGQLLLVKHPELQRTEQPPPPGTAPLSAPPAAKAPGATPPPAAQAKPANPANNLLTFPTTTPNPPNKP